jgi:hypothetical protein
MAEYRYKYQLVQALDDKIGPDLRKIVEGYLGPNPEHIRIHYSWLQYYLRFCRMCLLTK